VEPALAALESWRVAEHFRGARWGYATLSGAHILGIALLVGAVVPLNLRLLGVARSLDRTTVTALLVPSAAAGLALTVLTGAVLFTVRATEYAALGVLQLKLALVALGTLAAIRLHAAHGRNLALAPHRTLRAHAALSLACWLTALACGRLIAFMA